MFNTTPSARNQEAEINLDECNEEDEIEIMYGIMDVLYSCKTPSRDDDDDKLPRDNCHLFM